MTSRLSVLLFYLYFGNQFDLEIWRNEFEIDIKNNKSRFMYELSVTNLHLMEDALETIFRWRDNGDDWYNNIILKERNIIPLPDVNNMK